MLTMGGVIGCALDNGEMNSDTVLGARCVELENGGFTGETPANKLF